MSVSKKLSGNGMWESSRMMLPEHKETIVKRYHRSDYSAPSLDEQQMEIILRVLAEAYENKIMVMVTYHDNTREHRIYGIIVKIDTFTSKLKMKSEKGQLWINFDSLIDAYLSEVI